VNGSEVRSTPSAVNPANKSRGRGNILALGEERGRGRRRGGGEGREGGRGREE